MHLKCVCLWIYVRGLCVSCWKDVFSLWSSSLCAPPKSGAAKEGAPHAHYPALHTVALIKILLYLGPATLNYPRFTLAGKTPPHTAENDCLPTMQLQGAGAKMLWDTGGIARTPHCMKWSQHSRDQVGGKIKNQENYVSISQFSNWKQEIDCFVTPTLHAQLVLRDPKEKWCSHHARPYLYHCFQWSELWLQAP